MTLVEIVFAADRIRSASTRILGRFGAIEARIPTTSSDLAKDRDGGEVRSSFSEAVSKNPIGLVVNIAVSSRRKRS